MNKRRPTTPKQAIACCRPIDKMLEPDLFRTLADPTRVSLLACLAKTGRPCSVTEVAACCSVDLSVVSRHLALLESSGVLTSVKQGRTVLYTVRYRDLSQRLRALAAAIDDCCPAPTAARGGGHAP
jgi:ArsR family transcriptional regulator